MSTSKNSSASAAQITVIYDEVDKGRSSAVGKSVKKSSKGRRIVRKSEKPQSPKNLKCLKSCGGHRFEGTFTEVPVLYQQRSRASVEALRVFRALFAGPKSSLKALFASIIDGTQLMELLMFF